MTLGTSPATWSTGGRAGSGVARRLASTALIVVVLGVLPIAWDASAVWQVVGCVVSLILVVHTARIAGGRSSAPVPGTSGDV